MRISARNRLKGTVVEITKLATTAHVRIDVGSSLVTASMTNDAVDVLDVEAWAAVKASDVMVAVDD
ncbi:molybdopterin-binding protein [Microbacterium sp. NPDC016588]